VYFKELLFLCIIRFHIISLASRPGRNEIFRKGKDIVNAFMLCVYNSKKSIAGSVCTFTFATPNKIT